MGFSKDPNNYRDIIDILKQALESPRGLELTFQTTQLASTFLHRANAFRRLDRRLNAETYPPGHDRHGTSVYDALLLRKAKGDPVVTMRPRSLELPEVKEID